MGESMVWDTPVKLVGHEPKGQLTPRPVVSKVGVSALFPLRMGGIEWRGILGWSEEAPSVRLPLLVALRAVSLNCVGNDGAGLAGRLDRRQDVLNRSAGTACVVGLLRNGPTIVARSDGDSGVRTRHLVRQSPSNLEEAHLLCPNTMPGRGGLRVVGRAATVGLALAVGPLLAGEPLRMHEER